MKNLPILITSLALVVSACGGASQDGTTSTPPTTEPPPVSTTDPAAPVDPSLCDRNNTTDCATIGLVFEAPLPLSQALELLDGWLVVAVFRSEPACVVVPNWPDNQDGLHEESRFAYVDAPLIRERRLNAPGSPPITGHHIASGYWDHFEAEWRGAFQDDATITTAVVYGPIGTTATNAAVPGVVEVDVVPSYRADTVDERFAGELYIDGHEIPLDSGGPTEQVMCTPLT